METPSSERIHISFFGKCNAGKSSVVNAILGQPNSVVSSVKGTTTDPVSKSMELLPLGPVVITDTPGFDDEGLLGEMRVSKTMQVLARTDIAVIVTEHDKFDSSEEELLGIVKERKIPIVVVRNKIDMAMNGRWMSQEQNQNQKLADSSCSDLIEFVGASAVDGTGIDEIKARLASIKVERFGEEKKILEGFDLNGKFAVLVCPIDDAAPKGRLILPQQLVLREIIDMHGKAVVVQPKEVSGTLEGLKEPPAIVITDSQAFREVAAVVPENVPLTSFSILMARYKGFLETAVNAVGSLKRLKENDWVLVSEGCTHRRQCGDIGTVKIPAILKKMTGLNLNLEFSSGNDFPLDLSKYSLVIHCGGCMVPQREVLDRMNRAVKQNVPFTNYGIFLAHANGILERSLMKVACNSIGLESR